MKTPLHKTTLVRHLRTLILSSDRDSTSAHTFDRLHDAINAAGFAVEVYLDGIFGTRICLRLIPTEQDNKNKRKS